MHFRLRIPQPTNNTGSPPLLGQETSSRVPTKTTTGIKTNATKDTINRFPKINPGVAIAIVIIILIFLIIIVGLAVFWSWTKSSKESKQLASAQDSRNGQPIQVYNQPYINSRVSMSGNQMCGNTWITTVPNNALLNSRLNAHEQTIANQTRFSMHSSVIQSKQMLSHSILPPNEVLYVQKDIVSEQVLFKINVNRSKL
jgi:flagellar basal body-associated protein FliL